MLDALTFSGKRPEDIGYIEVNGSGSPVTDSVEMKALSDVYQLGNQALGTCFIGSVKPNIGHLLLASGLAGFIRCVLSVYHQKIPPFLSALDPFDYYDFPASRVRFNRETVEWGLAPGKKRIAAVSSFPDGGTNCHVIIEDYRAIETRRKYYPVPEPFMEKQSFPLQPLPVTEAASAMAEKSTAKTAANDNSFKEMAQKPRERTVESPSGIRIKNIWGEYDEENI